MTNSRSSLRIYTVVDVMSGVAVGVQTFLQLEEARRFLTRLRKGRSLDEDDVQLFEGIIDMSAVRQGVLPKSRAPSTRFSGTKPFRIR